MNKFLIFLLSLFSVLLLIKCFDLDYEIDLDDEDEDDDDDEYDDDGYAQFRKNLKDYLTEHNLINSDKLVKPKRMRKIFLETFGDMDVDGIPEQVKNMYQELADFFVEKYYTKKKEIRGKDVYKLFNFDEISMKFNEIYQANPYYGEDKLEKDYENQDFRADEYDYL